MPLFKAVPGQMRGGFSKNRHVIKHLGKILLLWKWQCQPVFIAPGCRKGRSGELKITLHKSGEHTWEKSVKESDYDGTCVLIDTKPCAYRWVNIIHPWSFYKPACYSGLKKSMSVLIKGNAFFPSMDTFEGNEDWVAILDFLIVSKSANMQVCQMWTE